MTKTYVEHFVEKPEHMRLFQQERAIYEVTELLEDLMRDSGISRADLAKKLGKTRGWITQLLDGDANKTIRTVADAFAVLGHEFRSFSKPIEIGTRKGQKKPTISDPSDATTQQVNVHAYTIPFHRQRLVQGVGRKPSLQAIANMPNSRFNKTCQKINNYHEKAALIWPPRFSVRAFCRMQGMGRIAPFALLTSSTC